MIDGFAKLDTSVPLALLPVRLEARVMDRVLKVRILPDTIHADAHETGLTATEIAAGQTYWTAMRQTKDSDSGAITVLRRALASVVGAHRAVWVANQMQPTDDGTLTTPEFPKRAAIEGAGPVMAQLLPKRWTYRIYDPGMSVLFEGACDAAVAPRLAMAPTLSGFAEGDLNETESGSDDHVDAFLKQQNLRWMVDFKQALAVGMAFEVPLGDIVPRFGAIVVVGASDDGALSQAEALDRQIEAHWYSGGADILPQGTPTNNTEGQRTGHAAQSDPDVDQLFVQDAQRRALAAATRAAMLDAGPAALLKLPAADALALAFGMTFACVFDRMRHANLLEGVQASIMNAAIGSGLGEYAANFAFAELGAPTTSGLWRKVARHHIDWVRAAGPLPSLRLGDQPYGVLPIQKTLSPKTAADPDRDLISVLVSLARYWRRARPLSHLDPDAADGMAARTPLQTVQVLLEVLGAVPHPQNFHQRGKSTARVTEDAHTINDAINDIWTVCRDAPGPHAQNWSTAIREFQAQITGLANSFVAIASAPSMDEQAAAGAAFRAWLAGGFINPVTRPETLEIYDRDIAPLIAQYQDATDAMPSLVADWSGRGGISLSPPAVTKPEPLLVHAHSLFDAASKPVTAEVTLDGTLVGLVALIDQITEKLAVPQNPNDRPGLLDGDAPLLEVLVHHSYLFVQNEDAAEFCVQLKLLKAGLAGLADRPATDPQVQAMVAVLQLRLRESLSTFMNRLDAWTTSFAARRLAETRAKSPRGIMIGGYGWLLDFAQTENAPSQGFMLTPSMAHATSLGVLRSGWSGYGTGQGTAPLSVDLTSDRVRGAKWIVDGVRNGQDLSETLGARFERYVHDADGPLDRFIDDFRGLTNAAKGLPDPKRQLTDGYQLARAFSAGRTTEEEALRDQIDLMIAAAGQPAKARLTRACQQLAHDLDAVADLLMAESVHGLAQGKYEQAASVANLLGDEDGAVPRVTVTASPQEGRPITHRIITLCPSATMPAASVTESCEPAIAAWLRSVLPDLSLVGCQITATRPGKASRQIGTIQLSDVLQSPLDALALAQRGESQTGGRLARLLAAASRQRANLREGETLSLRLDVAGWSGGIDVETFGVLLDAVRDVLDSARPLAPSDLSAADLSVADLTTTGQPVPLAQVDTASLDRRVALTIALMTGRIDALAATQNRAEVIRIAGELAAIGIAGALDLADAPEDPVLRAALIAGVQDRVVAMQGQSPDPVAQLALAMAKAVPVLPPLVLDKSDPVLTSAASSRLAAQVRADGPIWFAQIAKVAKGAAALADLSDLARSVLSGPHRKDSGAVQLPHFPDEAWAATDVPLGDDGPRLSLFVTDGHAQLGAGDAIAGFVCASWTEVIPSTTQQAALAYHFDAPSARAPQVVLLSMLDESDPEAQEKEVHQQLVDVIDQMKIRAVGPDRIAELGHYLPATFVSADGRLPTDPLEGAT